MKVLITPRGFANYGLDQIEWMEKQGISVHYNNTGLAYTHDEFVELAKDCDGIIVGVDKMDKEMMSQCPNLKVVCKFGVGTDNIDLDYAKEHNIYVGRTLGSNSKSVAEHVVGLMFSEAKNLYSCIKDVKENKWVKPTGYEINGKTLGIIGFGAIGKHLAHFVKGLDMKVLVYDMFPISKEIADEYSVEVVNLHTLLKESDYISLHIPLTPETENFISKKEFDVMKSNACIINAARGGIVDEEALYEALVNKVIRSACFDVFSVEPPSSDNKLLALDNFFLTAYTAARTQEAEKRTCEMSAKIIVEKLIDNKGE